MSIMTKSAAIAGGGFAGLSLGLALRQRGWNVRLFESSEVMREIGAGIFLWENALQALDKLGLLDKVRAVSARPESTVVIRDGVETARNATNGAGQHRMWTITRQALHQILVEAAIGAGVSCETGCEVIAADPVGRLSLADGRVINADLVVGADGIGSKVRQSLGIAAQRKDYNYGIIRLLLPVDGLDMKETVDYWAMSPKPRRILAVPCDEKNLYLALMCAHDDKEAAGLPLQVDTWSLAVPQLASYLNQQHDVAHYNVYGTVAVSEWVRGLCVLIGDSAHGMPPTMGQGAGSAIWNAVQLAQALGRYDDVGDALTAWERECRPETENTQRKSEELAAMGAERSMLSKADLLAHGSAVADKVNAENLITHDLDQMLNFALDESALESYLDQDWYRCAWELIQEKHCTTKADQLKRPAVLHFPRVMLRLLSLQPMATVAQLQAALLHDALEPGHYHEDDLLKRGVDPEAIRIISRIALPQDGRSYLDYIGDLASSSDRQAKEVKLADNYDAYDLYLRVGTKNGLDRVQTQYHPSVLCLRSALGKLAN